LVGVTIAGAGVTGLGLVLARQLVPTATGAFSTKRGSLSASGSSCRSFLVATR
jgi:hypothetical protein